MKLSSVPQWVSNATFISPSKLLEKFADKTTNYATIYTHQEMAYVCARNRSGNTLYAKMPLAQWEIANHIISVSPLNCQCSICQWRLKRKRYLYCATFNHITDFIGGRIK